LKRNMRWQIYFTAVLLLSTGFLLVAGGKDEGMTNTIGDAIMAKVEAVQEPLEKLATAVNKLAELTSGKFQILAKISTVLSAAGPILMIVGLALSIITAFLPQPDSKELAFMKKNFEIVINGLNRIESKIDNLEKVVIHEVTKGSYGEYERDIQGLYEDWQYAINATFKEHEATHRAIFVKQFERHYKYAAWNLVKAMTGHFDGELNNDLLTVAKDRYRCNIMKVTKMCASVTQTVIQGVALEGAYYAYKKVFDRALNEEELWKLRMKLLMDSCQNAVNECREHWRDYAEPVINEVYGQHKTDSNEVLASHTYQALIKEFNQRIWFVFAYDHTVGFEKHFYVTKSTQIDEDIIMKWRENDKMFTVVSFDRENMSEPMRMEEVTTIVKGLEKQVNSCTGSLNYPSESRPNRILLQHFQKVSIHPTAVYYSVKKSMHLAFFGEEGRYVRGDLHSSGCGKYKKFTIDVVAMV
jgi:hypothetical protein